MTEILTESFCERCGTRYTFESVAPRQRRLGRVRVLGRGLKNFVMSDDSSLDEAMAAARSDAEREATAQQLDAFHGTFNFCMSCRQYTCSNCWNELEARCLSCAPLAIAEAPLLAPEHDHAAHAFHLPVPGPDEAWPVASLPHHHAKPEPEAVAEPEAGAEAVAEPEPVAEPAMAAEPEPMAEPFGLEPGASLDDAIAAYEATLGEAASPAGPGVDVVAQPTWPAPPEAAPEPAVADVPPPTAPVAPRPAPAAARPAAPGDAPQWPTGPRWPTAVPARQAAPEPIPAGDPLAALMARQVTEAMWAASSRDVIQAPMSAQAQPTGVQPCVSCGISLSANARFCRRCGTSQAG